MGHKYGVTAVKVSPQSTMLATSSIDGTTLLWNLRVSRKRHRDERSLGDSLRDVLPPCASRAITRTRFTGNKEGRREFTIEICVASKTGTKIHTMVQMSGEAVRVCRFSPDSTLLATAGDNGQVCIWDLVHRNLIR